MKANIARRSLLRSTQTRLSDRFINEITSLPVHSITSIDVVPVPKDLTAGSSKKISWGGSDIIKQQSHVIRIMTLPQKSLMPRERRKKRWSNHGWCAWEWPMPVLCGSYDYHNGRKQEGAWKCLWDRANHWETKQLYHWYALFKTKRSTLLPKLPIGVRQVETMRTLLTQSLAVLMLN